MLFLAPLHDMYYVFNLFIVLLDENPDADKAYRENVKIKKSVSFARS